MSKYTKLALSLAVLLSGVVFYSFVLKGEKYPTIEVGAELPMPTYKMETTTGTTVVLSELAKENGLLVVFSCNTCPFVVGGGPYGEGWQSRYNELQGMCNRYNLGMVLVNSNEAKRPGEDSIEEMIKHAKEQQYQSIYALDKDSKLANAFGAKTTPHVFLFDKNSKLVYKGMIDDNNKSAAEVKERYLNNAINALVNGSEITLNQTNAMGCSIKRK